MKCKISRASSSVVFLKDGVYTPNAIDGVRFFLYFWFLYFSSVPEIFLLNSNDNSKCFSKKREAIAWIEIIQQQPGDKQFFGQNALIRVRIVRFFFFIHLFCTWIIKNWNRTIRHTKKNTQVIFFRLFLVFFLFRCHRFVGFRSRFATNKM